MPVCGENGLRAVVSNVVYVWEVTDVMLPVWCDSAGPKYVGILDCLFERRCAIFTRDTLTLCSHCRLW
jgi:hypothetical protein